MTNDEVCTLRSNLSDAELCRRNGWVVGTQLVGVEFGPDGQIWNTNAIQITAIGDEQILAKEVGPNCFGRETNWSLNCRDWKQVEAKR